jgi:23S rRNA pseudouridine2605 synthase
VRKLFEAVDLTVSRLIRIRYGAMLLPRGLKRGAWMELEESDIRALTQAAGAHGQAALDRPERAGAGKPGYGNARGPGAARGTRGGRGPIPAKKKFASPIGEIRPGSVKASPGQPDPLKTSVGYIGADSLTRQRKQQGAKPASMPFGSRGKGRPR